MTQVLQCEPVVTLTYFKARSTWVAYVNCKNEWVNCKKCHLKGKTGQDIDYSKKNGPKVSSAPILGLFSIIFKHVCWYIQQISGERLQDHWSSGLSSIFNTGQTFLLKGNFYFVWVNNLFYYISY